MVGVGNLSGVQPSSLTVLASASNASRNVGFAGCSASPGRPESEPIPLPEGPNRGGCSAYCVWLRKKRAE
jgi:hypothetical protein